MTYSESPLVSIVTPSYNKASYIEETILSIRNQSYPHIEHIVIDGGSTDDTLEILQKYSDRLIWISEPDTGQSDAINKGWLMAKGSILGSINADDTYLPAAIQTVADFLSKNRDVGMVYGKCDLIDVRGKKTGDFASRNFDLASYVRGPNIIPTPTVFFRADILHEVGYLDTSLHMSMDWDFHIRIGLRHKVVYIPQTLATYRLCPGTKTTAEFAKFGPDWMRIVDKFYSRSDIPDAVLKVKNQAYGNAHLQMSYSYWYQGLMDEARRQFMKAARLDPTRTLVNPWNLLALISSFLGTPLAHRLLLAKRHVIKTPGLEHPGAGLGP